MTDTRDHPVQNAQAHAAAVSEYRKDGYSVVDEREGRTVVAYQTRGSLLAHLALFFTVGWLTLGVANWLYARRKKKASHDRVAVVTRGEADAGEGEFESSGHETVVV